MELNKKERLVLWNQYEILKLLDRDNAKKYQNNQEILENGFEYEYDSLVSWMTDIPKEVCEEVYSILHMFRCLICSFDKLDSTSELVREDCMFDGFDGNEETDYYIYAKWLIEEDNKYNEFSKCDLDSHWNKLNTYRTMLIRFNEITSEKESGAHSSCLSLEELNYIIGK